MTDCVMLSLDCSLSDFAFRLRRRQLLTASFLAAAGLHGRKTSVALDAERLPGFGAAKRCLVLSFGEFGRSPRINKFSGRDHWPHVFSVLVAGAGIPGGTVFGASDRQGAYPAQSTVTAGEFHATVLHALGIPVDHEVHDQLGRPFQVAASAPRPEIFV